MLFEPAQRLNAWSWQYMHTRTYSTNTHRLSVHSVLSVIFSRSIQTMRILHISHWKGSSADDH